MSTGDTESKIAKKSTEFAASLQSSSTGHRSMAILGRQPKLGTAELERLLGAEQISPFGDDACFFNNDNEDYLFSRLGGSVKFCTVLRSSKIENWTHIGDQLEEILDNHCANADGKVSFGVSFYGIKTNQKKVQKLAINLKKAMRNNGHSVRVVPHEGLQLGSATVLHNKLTHEKNIEIVVVSDGKDMVIGKTTHEQDIESYTQRDRNRPYRDAKVGMLPPKLAQIIINLASKRDSINPISEQMILDPFCGTGVLIQEALLMGYLVHGSDIDIRMIDYTLRNIEWLYNTTDYPGTLLTVRDADATDKQWIEGPILDSIACETYLGQPLSTLPPKDQLQKIISSTNDLHEKFFMNLAKQIKPGTLLCCAVPAWRNGNDFIHLPVIDQLTDMGYTRSKLKHVRNEDLIYWREGQVVARELLVLEKK